MIEIPLSVVTAIAGSPQAFAAALEAHRVAVEAHMLGEAGVPAPVAHELVVVLVKRVPAAGPVRDRGPDHIEIAPYTVIDDTPLPAETQQALDVLRETISG